MKKIMFGGAFDLLHAAHVRSIELAKSFGDHLTVTVMSDARLYAKHSLRPGFNANLAPVIPEAERVEMIRALKWVNDVYCPSGDPDYPVFKALDWVDPNVLVLSEGENGEHLAALRDECGARGIEIITIPRIHVASGLDTTKIIEKIRS